ncbi:hypothetical protein AJ80_01832 [Polytolypa hystricis UAMH7299]|uniref:Ecp2 effector protein domain-containing protein n=1 Tax=Polytolypa hystricis (strain UAMH7299) TaxID=1447883 RepID=A0A2B7Z061_POLH7|nr:hypothetical protein AJ80_01832 [Polytolypa hystricis UAMH7299]
MIFCCGFLSSIFCSLAKEASPQPAPGQADIGQQIELTAAKETMIAEENAHPERSHNCSHPEIIHSTGHSWANGPRHAARGFYIYNCVKNLDILCPAQHKNLNAAITHHQQFPLDDICLDDLVWFQHGVKVLSLKHIDGECLKWVEQSSRGSIELAKRADSTVCNRAVKRVVKETEGYKNANNPETQKKMEEDCKGP